jgi:uncharacterized membrane protein
VLNKLRHMLEQLRSGLWFVPTLIVGGAVALAIGLIEAEDVFGPTRLAQDFPRLFGAGAAGARGLLESIAGSMITVAGVTFSITIVALTLASTQYSPRILRNFMRDRANQTVLGVFVGIYAYCLVVLRTIRGGGDDDGLFVPSLAVLVGLALAFVAIGFLIFFIHHVATAIQANTILEGASAETLRAIDRLFPAELGHAADASQRREAVARSAGVWAVVPARRSGFIQNVDADALLGFAREHDAIVRMERAIGEFVIEAQPLVAVAGAPVDDAASQALCRAFMIDRQRTVDQDPAFGIRQIVDIALKALSPGINDTTTAINCIDHLGVILSRLAARRIESAVRADAGAVRVLARGPSFASLLAEAMDQIRQNADTNVAVLIRLLEVLGLVSQRMTDIERRRLLREHADLMVETAERGVPAAVDRARIHATRAQAFAAVP